MPKVSVIVPVYNTEKYLRQCLDSVVNQTLQDIEVICIDDGSTDDSKRILDEYAHRDARILVYSKENGGQSSARNKGMDLAQGDYLYFLDSDDYILDTALECLYECAEAEQLDILFFGGDSFFENRELQKTHLSYLEYYHRKDLTKKAVTGRKLLQLFGEKDRFRSGVPLQFFNQRFLKQTGIRFFEGIIHEDELFTPLVLVRASRAKCISDNLYMRRVRENSTMTAQKSVRNFDGQFIVFANLLMEYLQTDWMETEGRDGLLLRVERMYRASKTTFEQLSEKAKRQLLQGEWISYRALFEKMPYTASTSAIAEKKAITPLPTGRKDEDSRTINYLQHQVVSLHKEINAIHDSATYRIGRFITSIPRKVRGAIRCYKEHGWEYTIMRVFSHLGLEDIYVALHRNKKRQTFKHANSKKVNECGIIVSVIVPVYNAEKYLEACIQSILSQTLTAFELICVDDGSTDRSKEIISDLAKHDKRILFIQQKNAYAGVARNNGMASARGKYLLFLDADDLFEPNMLETMVHKVEEDKADICLCGADRYHTNTGIYEPANWLLNVKRAPKKLPFNRKDCSRYIFQITSPAPWTKLFRSEFIKEKGLSFQQIKRCNDLAFTMSAMAQAEKITVVNQVLVHYRVDTGTSLQSTVHLTPMLFSEALLELKRKLITAQIWDEVKDSYADLALNTTVYNLKTQKQAGTGGETEISSSLDSLVKEFEICKHNRSFYSLPSNYDYLMEALR